MLPRIDTTAIAEKKVARTAIAAAITRLQLIESSYATATTAQKNQAIKDMAGYLKHVIKLVT